MDEFPHDVDLLLSSFSLEGIYFDPLEGKLLPLLIFD
jgi:hypothetical protein